MWNIRKSNNTYSAKQILGGVIFITTPPYPVLGIFLLMVLTHAVQAQIYKCENETGEVNFSDQPCLKGEASTRLNWLKSVPANKVTAKRKKTVKKSRPDNKAYVILSLLTTTQLELDTLTLRSSLGDKRTDLPELMLPDGIIVDLLKVDKIVFSKAANKDKLRAQFVMADGYVEEKILYRPYPVISGESKIGRFSKSLDDIKRIEFFNSEQLLKARGKQKVDKKWSKRKAIDATDSKKPLASQKPSGKEKSQIIELDLSHEVETKKKATGGKKQFVGLSDQQVARHTVKQEVKSSPKKKLPVKKLSPGFKKNTAAKTATKVQVSFVNDKKIWLLKSSLGSSRSSQKANGQRFILNDQEQIPYDEIKSIRVRPTEARNNLLVAVALKTGEIKMENMSRPFTRIQGKSTSGTFNHSLLEIKAISFQR